MKIKALSLAAICATIMACNKTENAIPTSIEFPGTVDNEAFASNVESISVINLQMEDNWAFVDMLAICPSENCLYTIDDSQLHLSCFDRQTGEKLAGRPIKGNGPGEINYFNSMFSIGDTLCIYDDKGNILQYDRNCKFIGKLHEFSDISMRYNLVRFDSGNYALVSISNPDAADNNAAIMLADKEFNITSRHFDVPQAQILIIGGSDPCFVVGDTLRTTFYFDCHLYAICGGTEKVTEFVVPNPITPEKANESFASGDMAALHNYDGQFYTAGGSGRFMMFGYRIGNENYRAMVDYRKNKATSMLVSDVEDNFESAANIVSNLILKSMPTKSADGCIYALCKNRDFAKILEGHDDVLDARLQKTQTEYRAYLDRNAEYMKDLEPEERDAANVILKIKLKD